MGSGARGGAIVAAIVGAWSLASARASAADAYTGPDIVNVVSQTADVMRIHQWFLRTAMDVDSAPGYVSDGIGRYMPASFRYADGRTFKGTLFRITGTSAIGGGNPRTGTAWFGGISLDIAGIDAGGGTRVTQNIDGFLFVGGAWKGVMVSGGLRFLSGWTNLDAQHRFAVSGPESFYRPGTPPSVISNGSGDAVKATPYAMPMINIHHAEGVTLGGAFDVVEKQLPDGTYTASRTLSVLRGLLEPEPWIRRIDLRKYGVPLIGLDRFAPGVDRWGDHAVEARKAYNENKVPAPSSDKATYEVPFGVDDLAQTGIRVKGVAGVYPERFVREVEVAWAYSIKNFEAGARAFAFRRVGKYEGSGEAFAAVNAGGIFRFAISYSYNVPESSTFYPIPNASVLGLQFTFGDTRFARPIVPLLACAKANAPRVQALKDSRCSDGTGVPHAEEAP